MNITEDATATINLLVPKLEAIGYTYQGFELDGTSFSRFTHPERFPWLTRNARITYPMTHASVSYLSTNKEAAYLIAQRVGVNTPATLTATAGDPPPLSQITQLMQKHGSLIIKPATASLSNGLSLHLTSDEQIEAALKKAFSFSDKALIQQQVQGEEVRFVVVDGVVRAALLRQTPRLVGNGIKTVAQLLQEENHQRQAIKGSMVQYPLLETSILSNLGLSPDTPLEDKKILELSRATMIKNGASVFSILEQIHASYVQIATELAEFLGARFIVVDMMIEDYQITSSSSNYHFIEFNTAPVLKLFYSCRDGKHYDVIKDIVPLIDKSLQR